MRHVHALRVAGLLALASATARADHAATADARVRDFVYAADDAYRDGRYDAAADAFEEAYRLKAQPAILFNIGKCHEKSWLASGREGSLRSAVEAYRRYLAEVDRSSPKSRHLEAEQALERLSPALDRSSRASSTAPPPSTVRAPVRATRLMIGASVPGATARVDNGKALELPTLDPVTPGTHHIVVSRDEYLDDVRDVVVAEGELFPVHAELRPAPGRLQVSATSGAAIYVDGRFAGRAPLAKPLVLDAGMHEVAAVEEGRVPWGQRVTVTRAGDSAVDAPLRLSAMRWSSYVLMGAAGAVGAYASYEVGSAIAHEVWASRFLQKRDKGEVLGAGDLAAYNHDGAARDEARARAYTYGTIASILGLAAAGLYFFDKPTVADVSYDRESSEAPKAPAPAPSVVVSPGLTSSSAGLDVRVSF